MMTSKFKQPGEVLNYTAGANIANGQVLVVGVRIGVALTAIANGAVGSVQVSGVFTLTKNSADNIAQGALVYWDNTNSRITSTASGNTLAGYAFNAAGAGVTSIDVKINA